MKLIGFGICVCVLLFAVNCVESTPVKRADSPPVTAPQGKSNIEVGTASSGETGSGSGSGSGSEVEPDQPKPDENFGITAVSLSDLSRIFYQFMGTSLEEWLSRSQKSQNND